MKLLPSLEYMYKKAVESFQRFPLVIVDAIVGTGVGILLIEGVVSDSTESLLVRLLLTLVLGFPLFLSVHLYGERHKWKPKKQSIALGVAIIFLVGYFALLPNPIQSSAAKHFFRFMLYAIGFTLAVSFAPFIEVQRKKSFFRWPWKTRDELNGFWQYSKILVERLAVTGVFTGVLFFGLAIALGASDALLGINIPGEIYPQMWTFIVGIIASWFFVAGIPKDFAALEEKTDYHDLIKRFSQYILIPLVGVYAVILYAYTAKIFYTGDWPDGTISYLILGFAALGISAYILLYPLRNQKDHAWVQWFQKMFFIILVPQVLVLFYAVWLRISHYGLTENRYFLIVLGLWLIAMAGYFMKSKKQNLKVLPISFFSICLIVSFGPWGAMGMSESNQSQRLASLFEKHTILVDGKIQKTEQDISKKELQQMSSILDYLNNTHGLDSIQPWFIQDLNHLKHENDNEVSNYNRPEFIMEQILGLEHVSYWDINYRGEEGYFNLNVSEPKALSSAGYDYFQNFYAWSGGADQLISFETKNGTYGIKISLKDFKMYVYKNDKEIATTDIEPFFATTYERYIADDLASQSVTAENVAAEYIENGIRIKIYFLHMNGTNADGELKIDGVNGYVLIGLD
jgi:hypothetical protein